METWGWGMTRQDKGFASPQQHPQLTAVLACQDTVLQAGLGLPGEGRATAAREEARRGSQEQTLPRPPSPAIPKDREQQGCGEGTMNPRGTAATLSPVQGSPQTDGTAPSLLPRGGAMSPQPSAPGPGLSPARGPRRPLTRRTQTRCRSGSCQGAAASPPAATQPGPHPAAGGRPGPAGREAGGSGGGREEAAAALAPN